LKKLLHNLRVWLVYKKRPLSNSVLGFLGRRGADTFIRWRWPRPLRKPFERAQLRLYSDGGGIGDEVMCTAVFREIRRRNPRCRVTFITRHSGLFRSNANIDVVEPYSADAIRGAIRLTYGPSRPPARAVVIRLAECVGLRLQNDQPDLFDVTPSPGVRAKIDALQKPLIMIQPQTSGYTPNKQWSLESWKELIRLLVAEFDVVELGTITFFPNHEFGGRFHALAGLTTIADFAWIISQASVFIGPVSAGMHVASAFEVRSIIIYGGYESSEGYRYPFVRPFYSAVPCAPCWLDGPCPYDRKCLSAIQPEEVFQAARAAVLDPHWTSRK